MESPRELSSDILCEILSRSTLETVGRCRLVSKDCNNLTYEHGFKALHHERANIASGWFVQNMVKCKHYSAFVSINDDHNNNKSSCPKPTKLSLDFLPVRAAKIEASSCQGLLLCTNDNNGRGIPSYFVCKPTTQEWERLPNPKTRNPTKATALMVLGSNPLHYKIVRLSMPKSIPKPRPGECGKCYNLRLEIFDSKLFTWKQLPEVDLLRPDHSFLGSRPPVSASGSLHWLPHGSEKPSIFAFHGNNDTCSLISLPRQEYPPENPDPSLKIAEYMGKLALMIRVDISSIDLWVMEDYEKRVWHKRQTINIEPLTRLPNNVSLSLFHDSEVALVEHHCHHLIFYNIKTLKFDMVSVPNRIETGGIFPYQSDFELCNIGKGKGKKAAQGWKMMMTSLQSVGKLFSSLYL
ncbi:hypothetical protein Tsubulata_012359 [Turnera subulata]|uniref:F-box associated domain-containing protein n=1 Tax=Turnera subulata TaxID=218843 RepID=A0A9Q0F190_9ROSI|nr:hypothetical protein Tsubulata_012359 [Turnera subulata]